MGSTSETRTRPDLRSYNFGSIIRIIPLSTRGMRWCRTWVISEEETIDCDHRCGLDILQGAFDAGLTLEDGTTGRIAHRKAGGS